MECWQCGRNIDDVAERYFCECGVVQPPLAERSFFDVMGVKETFDLDLNELTEKYRGLQRILHPDKYSQKCDVCTVLLMLEFAPTFLTICQYPTWPILSL